MLVYSEVQPASAHHSNLICQDHIVGFLLFILPAQDLTLAHTHPECFQSRGPMIFPAKSPDTLAYFRELPKIPWLLQTNIEQFWSVLWFFSSVHRVLQSCNCSYFECYILIQVMHFFAILQTDTIDINLCWGENKTPHFQCLKCLVLRKAWA